jgi:tetratricopeptide (TPR) repeat protein
VTDGPVDPGVEFGRAAALLGLRRADEALAAARRGLEVAPEDPRGLNLLARAQLALGDPGAALHSANRVLAVAPDDPDGHFTASRALSQLGRYTDSVRAAQRAAALAPLSWSAMARVAEAHAANPWTRDWTEAREAAARCVALAPDRARTHVVVGMVEAAAKDRAAAEAAFNRALALDPEDTLAHHELARLRLQGSDRTLLSDPGRLAEAASGFATALRTDPRATVSRRNLDLLVRIFLVRASYLLFLAALLGLLLAGGAGAVAFRVIPLVVLVVPALFVGRFLARLPASLRPYLRRSLVVPRSRAVAAGADGLAVAAVVAGAAAPEHLRPLLAVAASALAMTARVILRTEPARSAPRR